MPNTAAIISERGSNRKNPGAPSRLKFTGRSASSSTRCSTPLVSFLSANWAYIAEFYGFLRRERYFAVAVSSPMVLAICWVNFNGKLEVCWIIAYYGASHFSVAEFFEFENVGFSADAPWPKTVAVAVRNKRKLSRLLRRQFMGGSDAKPVSKAWICFVMSW